MPNASGAARSGGALHGGRQASVWLLFASGSSKTPRQGHCKHSRGDLRQQRRPKGGSSSPTDSRAGSQSPSTFIHHAPEFYSPRPPSPKPCGRIARARRQDATSLQPCGGFHASNRTANATCRVSSAHGNGKLNSRRLSNQQAAVNNQHVRLRGDSPKRHPLTPAARRMENPPPPELTPSGAVTPPLGAVLA